MNYKLSTRVRRLIKGSLNAMMDNLEEKNPALVHQQLIHELNKTISEATRALGKMTVSKYRLNKQISLFNGQHENLSAQIEIAVHQQRDDLARAAIAKQIDIEEQLPMLENELLDIANEEQEVKQSIRALQAKKRQYHSELQLIKSEQTKMAVPMKLYAHDIDQADKTLAEIEHLAFHSRVEERLIKFKNMST